MERRVAVEFLRWLAVPPGRTWLDVGCGTGALTATVLATAAPTQILGVDPSEGFLDTARASVTDPRAGFRSGDARALPLPDGGFDAVVSGLALNFVPDPALAVAELARVAAPGGVVAAYVWDYADGMQMSRVCPSSAGTACGTCCAAGCRWPRTARSRSGPALGPYAAPPDATIALPARVITLLLNVTSPTACPVFASPRHLGCSSRPMWRGLQK